MSPDAEQERARPRAHVVTWFGTEHPVEGTVFVKHDDEESSAEDGDHVLETR